MNHRANFLGLCFWALAISSIVRGSHGIWKTGMKVWRFSYDEFLHYDQTIRTWFWWQVLLLGICIIILGLYLATRRRERKLVTTRVHIALLVIATLSSIAMTWIGMARFLELRDELAPRNTFRWISRDNVRYNKCQQTWPKLARTEII